MRLDGPTASLGCSEYVPCPHVFYSLLTTAQLLQGGLGVTGFVSLIIIPP